MRRLCGLGLILVMALIGAVAPAAAGPGGDADCRQGGWASVAGADGRTFSNQGQCVSYVQHGGEVAPATGSHLWQGPQPSDPIGGATLAHASCRPGGGHLVDVRVALEATPDGPAVAISGVPVETVSGGTFSWSLDFLGVPIDSGTMPLAAVTTLPTDAGDLVVWRTRAFPSSSPQGAYELQVSATDQNGSELTCVTTSFTI